MIEYMGETITATELEPTPDIQKQIDKIEGNGFDYTNFFTGLSETLKGLTPFANDVIDTISTSAAQKRVLENRLEMAKIQNQNPIQVIQNDPMKLIIPAAIAGAAVLIITRKKKRR